MLSLPCVNVPVTCRCYNELDSTHKWVSDKRRILVVAEPYALQSFVSGKLLQTSRLPL